VREPASTNVPSLETARLRLRDWQAGDIEAYARILADREAMRYLGFGLAAAARHGAAALASPVARMQARRAIARYRGHWLAYRFGQWAIEEKESGELIGRIGLFKHSDWTADGTNDEVGWLLARSTWGNGFATEGGRASLGFAFGQLGLPRVVSITQPANARSMRVMERLGLSLVGRTWWRGGEVVWYAIDRDAWLERGETASG